MKRRQWLQALASVAVAGLVAGCATTPPPKNIADTIAGRPDLSTASKLLADAGLTDTLKGPGPFTVFVPSDEAFKRVPAATLDGIVKDKKRLTQVLTHHVVPGTTMAADVKSGDVKNAAGANLPLARSGTFVTVDDAMVTEADIVATNGVIHVIDRVIVPPVPR